MRPLTLLGTLLLAAAPQETSPGFRALERDGALLVERHGRTVAVYQLKDRRFDAHPLQARCGYFRELFTPSGRLLTEDGPADHLHHRGLFLSWNRVSWSDDPARGWKATANFWELTAASGRRGPGVLSDVQADSFTVRHEWKIGERKVVDETLRCRIASPSPRVFTLDLDFTLAAADGTVELDEYGHHNKGKGPWYGTLGFRGAAAFAPQELAFSYSDGRDRAKTDNARAEGSWVGLSGKLDGEPCGVVLQALAESSPARLSHFRSLRFLCADISDPKPVRIEPGTPLRLRFRVLLHDGPADTPEVAGQIQK